MIIGDDFGAQMENAFAEDLRNSVEVTKEKWAQRPLMDHLKEGMARMFEYWL